MEPLPNPKNDRQVKDVEPPPAKGDPTREILRGRSHIIVTSNGTTGKRNQRDGYLTPLSLELLYPNGTDEPPDYKALRDHLKKEGRIRKEDCLDIIKKVIDIVSNEPNLLRLQDPITIVGDIHGQYYDFLKLLEVGGNPDNTQFLFLGDYVDRGSFSIEVLLHLYALKINFPNKIWLIRGNHECRQMTSFFNFRDECEYKYDMVVYYAFMESFDTLPLSAVINGKFLAVHGGLSPQLVLLNQICSFTRFQEPPRSGIFCDILWADPIDEDKEEHTIQTESFFPNDIRGCSYFFGYNAATTFLEKNGLLSIIRAHEAQLEGYKMHQTNLKTGFPIVITIFSAPNYCDVYNNKGAVLKFDSNTLNIQQFSFSPHPYHLPNFMNLFTWSLPFVSEKVTEMLYCILNSSVNQSDEGVMDVVLPTEILQIINYIEENNMKLEEHTAHNGVATHGEGTPTEGGLSSSQREEALLKEGCFYSGASKNEGEALEGSPATAAESTQQMDAQGGKAAHLPTDDAQASKERSDALRKKVQSVGRLMRVFRTLRKENELIVQLKGCSPGYRIPVGLLLQGREGLENELEKFKKAKQIDSINEKRPPNE
ncbi:protein phosphatase 3, catalytic subunit [Plasmodium inui San Antonio 1]|uniref:Serine/threonine-protein phosphatase n=1 Tax=Plasmodium inui San Antonio 1 TaxID=1237626 RepID=W7A0A1_9APIC|nr:protein phosphatase 3, catalytic subunit [Plasmodium inui San Antonio 1]EUD66567.1 protein phosphatase 3, catalytic subunit [Plasmodium inui San Antonio 1]